MKIKCIIKIFIFYYLAVSMCYGQESWRTMTLTNAPSPRTLFVAQWTGSFLGGKMVVWGGAFPDDNTGGIYNPWSNSWSPTSTVNAPSPRYYTASVWTGTKFIVWGGFGNYGPLFTGGIYDPVNNSWTAVNPTNAPTARSSHTAIWTGSKMIIWGGDDNVGICNTGGIYDPISNSWTSTDATGAPSARDSHTAVWTGSLIGGKMIVWGGEGADSNFNDGGIYDPNTNSWNKISSVNAPSPRHDHTAIWTGSALGGKMIIWGGESDSYLPLNDGDIYDPVADNWSAINTTNAPSGRFDHTAVWTGSKMIIWGGCSNIDTFFNDGGIYDPVSNQWTGMTLVNAPSKRYQHIALWADSEMIVWGGRGNSDSGYNTGAIYHNHGLFGIEKISSNVPSKFLLEQNYPNPFNPSTTIKYQIEKTSDVKMIVYDILGRELATLINERQEPGSYEVQWDAIEYSSGVYFYKLTAANNSSNFIQTKKMIIIK